METDNHIAITPEQSNGKETNGVHTTTPFAGHGDDIEEIISNKPPSIVRWGTLYFLFILFLLSAICWFVQYPDVVTTKARLSSINAPKEVVTRTDGKLQNILVKNDDFVKAGTPLAFMESIANPKAVNEIKTQIDSIVSLINQNNTNEIVRFFPDYASQNFLREFGELQEPFQTFMQSFISFRDFISNGFYLRKRNMLQTDLSNIQRLHSILLEQQNLLQQDVSLAKQNFNANESLANDKVIAPVDYRNEKSKLIGKQLTLPQASSAIVSNETQQNEKKKEISELENQIIVQKNSFIQALQTFSSQIEQWEYTYILKAPVSGKISFAGFFQENQFIKNGQLIFNIKPDNTNYFAEMLVPQYNFGKIKEGQEVLLKFQAYPYEQFGSVTGKIEFISTIPTDSGFLAKISLPHGLTTNYNKKLQYQYGLFAQADIVTENIRLLESFYYNIRKQFSR